MNEKQTKKLREIGSPNDKIELQEIDLEGACIVPGFNDAHMHPGFYVYKKTQLDLSGVKSYAELQTHLEQADQSKSPARISYKKTSSKYHTT